MANRDEPQGFRPKGEPLRMNKYIASAAIYPGDAVALASGKVAPYSSGAALGVAASYAAADGDACMVYDAPDQLYIVQADETEVDAQADIGLQYAIVATAGNSAYRVSRQELDSSTGAADADKPLTLLAIEERPDNALGAQVDCIVKITRHQLADVEGADNT